MRREMKPLLIDTMKSLEIVSGKYDDQTLLSRCPKGKRKQYSRALDSLLEWPVDRSDRKVKAFVKMEKAELLKPQEDGTWKMSDPRIIQARGLRYNVELGRYTRAIEDQLKNLVDPAWQAHGIMVPVVAKGHNLIKRAQVISRIWNLYDSPVALSLDLSRWDMHVSTELLQLMCQFYLGIFPDPYLEDLLASLTDSRCKSTQGVVYTKKHGVTSGDMTTALGNCVAVIVIVWTLRSVVEGCVMVGDVVSCVMGRSVHYVSCQGATRQNHSRDSCPICQINIAIGRHAPAIMQFRQKHKHPSLTVYDDGDDHVMIVDRELQAVYEEVLPHWWEAAGHKLKVEGIEQLVERILFCQMRPMMNPPQMVPDPRKVMATSLCLTGQWKHQWRSYLKTVWRARAILHQGVAILGPLFYKLQRRIGAPLLTGPQIKAALMRQEYWLSLTEQQLEQPLLNVKPTEEARMFMERAWGISVEQQLCWENLKIRLPDVSIMPEDVLPPQMLML